MRRFGRHLLTLCSIISAIVLICVLVAWIAQRRFEFNSVNGRPWEIDVERNTLSVWTASAPRRQLPKEFQFSTSWQVPGLTLAITPSQDGSHRMISFDIAMPWITLPAAVLPAIAVNRGRRWLLRRRYARRGRCVSCGYDLRASPERCPECGAVNPGAV